MIGTEKQIKWALDIQQGLQCRYPNERIPENQSAQFWIEHRNIDDLEKLRQVAATYISSPCTKTYPKIMRADIEPLMRNMGSFAVFDTETTGLPKHKNVEIVEIAIVAFETGEILLNTLFKPKDMQAYLDSEARGMHAFVSEKYKDAPTFPEKWEEIQHILTRYHLAAYNADFDIEMLIRTAHLWGIAVPRIKATCVMEAWQIFMTTESMSRETYKLARACEVAGIDQGKYGIPHTALADVFATRELLMRMRRYVEGDVTWDCNI